MGGLWEDEREGAERGAGGQRLVPGGKSGGREREREKGREKKERKRDKERDGRQAKLTI